MQSKQWPLFSSLPAEFDMVKAGHGFTLRGWDFTRAQVANALADGRMLNAAFELGTNACPWDCPGCFTEQLGQSAGKRPLAGELTLERRLFLIDEAAKLGCRTINFVGAGEPTTDCHFWTIVGRISERGMTPVVYSEASTRLTDSNFASRLYEIGATVVVKANSLFNSQLQNGIVRGNSQNPKAGDYFRKRAEALDLLMRCGFNSTAPTRLGINMPLERENMCDAETAFRWARSQNIFPMIVSSIPVGRGIRAVPDPLRRNEIDGLFAAFSHIDETEFGLHHASGFPYGGATPCTIRGLGIYVKIDGRTFDCPGQGKEIGNILLDSLDALWRKLRKTVAIFDGGCLPREQWWANSGVADGKVRLPILR